MAGRPPAQSAEWRRLRPSQAALMPIKLPSRTCGVEVPNEVLGSWACKFRPDCRHWLDTGLVELCNSYQCSCGLGLGGGLRFLGKLMAVTDEPTAAAG